VILRNDRNSDSAGRDPADFDLLIGNRARRTGHDGRKEGHTTYWLTYPVTLVECALMAFVSVVSYWLLRVFYLKWWHPENLRQRPRRVLKQVIDVEAALGAMQTVERIAQDSRARIFWISGTLLGLERLGQPLPHDNDLDVGIHIDDPHCEDFIRALWNSRDIGDLAPQLISWKTQVQNPDLQTVPGGIIRYKASVRNGDAPHQSAVKMDVFLHFPYCGGSIHGTRNSIWWNTTPGVAARSYKDRLLSVPEDSHLYLTENYGNYRSEVKDFENSIDCPNAMNIFSWRSLAYLLSRLQVMLKLGRIDRAHQINMRVKATILKGLFPPDVSRLKPQLQ
jgi:hypothetical protein